LNKYLIWDFDGTLAQREGMWSGAILEALEAERPGHGITVEQIRPCLQSGFPWHEPNRIREANLHPDAWWKALNPVLVKACSGEASMDDAQAQRLCAKVREAYANPARWVLFDDVVPCLTKLSAEGWKHVILSNHVPELNRIVEALGISSYFEAVFNSAETGIEKPNPKAFQNVLASLGEARQIWVIGDSITADVIGARSVGLRSVLVRKRHAEAELCCETLDELATLFVGANAEMQRDMPGGRG
jgi:putative hydrolase of the HAD superfamily